VLCPNYPKTLAPPSVPFVVLTLPHQNATSMPILHEREDGSGFYIRARFGDSIVTYQVSPEGERWLRARDYRNGATIDGEVLDYLRDQGAVYTEGSGPGHIGFDLDSGTLVAPQSQVWVKHLQFGIGQITEDLGTGRCRVIFLKDAAGDPRDVAAHDLRRPTALEVAREKELAWRQREAARRRETIPERSVRPMVPKPSAAAHGTPAEPSPPTVRPGSGFGCLSRLAVVVLLTVWALG